MGAFLDWFNTEEKLDPVIKAGIAHLWFVTIHPFDDGNGRIARAIADMQLARGDGSRQRLMINKLLEGFEGKLTSIKWADINKCSPDTALRDITGLISNGILRKDAAGGRSTNYELNL